MPLRNWLHALVLLKRHIAGQLTPPELSVILPLLRPNDICFDIGAHGGSWTVPLADAVPQGHVYAFEALPYYADVLTHTLAFLGRRNVTLVNRAVSDEAASVDIVWQDSAGKRLTGLTHIASANEEKQGTIRVPSVTLDSFCAEQGIGCLRFLKCDVEGAELLIFRGAERILAMSRPIVYCELNRVYCERYGYAPEDVFAFFKRLGYTAQTITPSGVLAATDAASYAGKGDVLFTPDMT